jgi:tRNA 2-thiocytidine biosynthesis protein TtcA
MDLQKTLLRSVGKAIHEYGMIREGDRIAVAVSGGKDSLTLLDALLLLQKRAPIAFTVRAFTVEQGKFLRPIEPLADYMKLRGVDWTYYRDEPSFQLLEEQPNHGCDLCSRYRRRAVYEIAHDLGANVVALGHTLDDFCESLLRNTFYTGRLSALPAVTHSRARDFRLIRPLVFVSEDITQRYAEEHGIPITPCVCSHRSGTVRRNLREFLDEMKKTHPNVLESMLSAMKNVDTPRLLDLRLLETEANATLMSASDSDALLPIVAQETL